MHGETARPLKMFVRDLGIMLRGNLDRMAKPLRDDVQVAEDRWKRLSLYAQPLESI